MTDEFEEFDTPAEEIDQEAGEGQYVQFMEWHQGCVHGPDVTHSPNMRLRLWWTWSTP